MKCTAEMVVSVPRTRFIKKVSTAENRKHWQNGLNSSRPLTRSAGEFTLVGNSK